VPEGQAKQELLDMNFPGEQTEQKEAPERETDPSWHSVDTPPAQEFPGKHAVLL